MFTARYGNIYTTLQLLQLIDRAYGRFVPAEAAWHDADGALVDPFRPTVQPGGFASSEELETDRARHLACVREAFETLDVFVFTLGLTEAWLSSRDGAAFPLCPGGGGGALRSRRPSLPQPARVRDTSAARVVCRAAAPRQPPRARAAHRVPGAADRDRDGAACAGSHHLFQGGAARRGPRKRRTSCPACTISPSYEIVTGPQAKGRFYAPNLREVTPERAWRRSCPSSCGRWRGSRRRRRRRRSTRRRRSDEAVAVSSRVGRGDVRRGDAGPVRGSPLTHRPCRSTLLRRSPWIFIASRSWCSACIAAARRR